MRVGIVADTHDRLDAVERAVSAFRDRDVDTVIHCGDIESPGTVSRFEGFAFHAVLGNNDRDRAARLDEAIAALGRGSELHGRFADLTLDGTRFAVTHGLVEADTRAYAESGEYDFVLHGHFHETEATPVGDAVILNPGAHRSVVVLDTETGDYRFVDITA